MLKIFSLIEFGERAGSGLSGIWKRWEKVYHTPVTIEETHKDGVDRTVLTLSTGGHEQDVKAMLEIYGGMIATSDLQTDQETTRKDQTTDQETTKSTSNDFGTDQETIVSDQEKVKTISCDQETIVIDQISDQKIKILNLIKLNPNITRSEIGRILELHDSSVKRRLERLISEGLIRRMGSTKAGHWEVLIAK